MITVYANNYNKSQRDKITEDTTPMSDRYETQPKIASGLQQSAHKASLTRPPSAQLLPEPQVEKLCSACLDLIRSAPGWGWQPLWGLAVTSPLPATDPEHSKPGGAGVRGRALSGGSPRGARGAGAEPVRICRGLP